MGYKIILITFSVIVFGTLVTNNTVNHIERQPAESSYVVKRTTYKAFDIKEPIDTLFWDQAETLSNFQYPWRDEAPPETKFKALYDATDFYFIYTVTDSDLIVDSNTGLETDVMNSDRVELFFLTKGTMTPYYCLEIDAKGKLFDYSAEYYRKNEFDWQWPQEHIDIEPFETKQGYIIVGRINLEYLEQLGILDQGEMQVGLFRANVVGIDDEKPIFKWISWIMPDSKEPDFHVPSAFGTFVLGD